MTDRSFSLRSYANFCDVIVCPFVLRHGPAKPLPEQRAIGHQFAGRSLSGTSKGGKKARKRPTIIPLLLFIKPIYEDE
jgi:hypothetical protein